MRQKKLYPAYLMVVPLVFFCIFFVLPSTVGYFYAFTDWNQFVPDVHFIGLNNFKEMFKGDHLRIAFQNTVIFGVVKPIVVTVLGFLFAIPLNRKLRSRHALRAVYFIPTIFSALVVGLIFSALFNTQSGAVNQLLNSMGAKSVSWLGGRWTALLVMNLTEIWRSVGYAVVITLAGLQSISADMLEAASIDGATGWKKFTKIILPLIMPSVNVNILYSLIYGLKQFDLVYLMTRGGPGYQTETLGTMVMNEMSRGKYGQSTAINLVFTVFLVLVAILYQKFSSRWERIES